MLYRAVIVEDDPMVSLLNRTFIEKDTRFRVVQTFQDGQAALNWLAQNPADLVVLDVYMPIFTGLELLQALRRRDIPVDAIMVTAANDAASVDTLTPAYYETTLEQRAGQMEDPDALEMLKVIFGNRVIDIGIVMSGSARTVLIDTIKNRENFSFTSLRGQHISKMNEDLDRVIKAIQNDFKPTEESES